MKTVGISPKVIASTVVTGLISAVLAVLTWVRDNPNVIPGPQWLQGLLVLVLPPLLSFLAGYNAKPGPVVRAE